MNQQITVNHVCFEYQREGEEPVLVLQDLNLSIQKGEFVAVLGHNGFSGKSTLAKHFNALLLTTVGTVLVNGIDTTDENRLFDIRQQVWHGVSKPRQPNRRHHCGRGRGVCAGKSRRAVGGNSPPSGRCAARGRGCMSFETMRRTSFRAGRNSGWRLPEFWRCAGMHCVGRADGDARSERPPRGVKDHHRAQPRTSDDHRAHHPLYGRSVQADRVVVVDHGKIVLEGTAQTGVFAGGTAQGNRYTYSPAGDGTLLSAAPGRV